MQSDSPFGFQSISSKDNRALKLARKVRDGKRPDEIFIEGKRLFDEAVRSGIELEAVFVDERFDVNSADLRAVPAESRYRISSQLMRGIADTENPQGIVAIARRPNSGREAIEKNLEHAGTGTVIYLHRINNPANLGAIFRTAEGSGAAGVVISSGSAAAFSPKSLRAAMGSAFRCAIWEGVEPEEAIAWAREKGLRLTATEAEGSRQYTELEWQAPRLLLLGSEAHGLPDEILREADERVAIPLAGDVESLNIAVAAGVLLFAAAATRGQG